MAEDRWKKLDVWKISDEMALKVYSATKNFPKEELYGLTSQVRRAALSIPTNIVEGYSRRGDKELAYFLNISLGCSCRNQVSALLFQQIELSAKQ